jgi:uncharacterized protein
MTEYESGNFRGDEESMDEPGKNPGEQLEALPPSAPSSASDFGSVSRFQTLTQRIFIGQNGLRWIWRLVLYLILFRGVQLCFSFLLHHLPALPSLWKQLVLGVGFAIVIIAPALVMAKIERRAFDCYGLPLGKAFGRLFWQGMLWGIGSLTLLMLALRMSHAFYFGSLALHGARLLKFALFWAVFFLIVGIYEEFFTRGYTQFTLSDGIGFWPAAILLSLGFGALHLGNPGETWVGLLGVVVIGLFFCLTLRRTGTLWFAVGFHTSWDWGESYFYSVADSGGKAPGHLLNSSLQGPVWLSGGSVGPEGSILVFVLIVLLFLAFSRVYSEVRYPHTPVENSSATGLTE